LSEPAADDRSRSSRVATALLVSAVFVPRIANGIYEGLDREPPPALDGLSLGFFLVSMWVWFFLYSRARRISWVMDMGWLLMIAWPVILPYYIVKAEGRRGLSRIGLFCLLYFGALMTEMAISIWLRVLVSAQ
jgi:hypothetical protein